MIKQIIQPKSNLDEIEFHCPKHGYVNKLKISNKRDSFPFEIIICYSCKKEEKTAYNYIYSQ